MLVCKLTEAATIGETKTCEIWDADDQENFLATGETIEVHFRVTAGSSGSWVLVAETVRGYVAVNGECTA